MAGLTNAESQATLDARFPTTGATDHIAYSTNGTTEFGGLARTAVTARLRPTGSAAASSAVTGAATLIAGPVVLQASSTVTASTNTTGTVTYRAAVAGTVAATSAVSGAATTFDPDFVPPELEVGPATPPRFLAAAARPVALSVVMPAVSLTAGPARPNRYGRHS